MAAGELQRSKHDRLERGLGFTLGLALLLGGSLAAAQAPGAAPGSSPSPEPGAACPSSVGMSLEELAAAGKAHARETSRSAARR
jgi:hypothetical protein